MKELSLNILDIAENSVKARAKNVSILLEETDSTLTLTISDDGCGMSEEMVKNVTDPFCTTRTTRKVGLGIPFLKLASEQTGGEFSITSKSEADFPLDHGTKTSASFIKGSIDFTPLGDIVSTITTLIHGSPEIDWYFKHSYGDKTAELDTRAIREAVGQEIPLNSFEIIEWISESLKEEYSSFDSI